MRGDGGGLSALGRVAHDHRVDVGEDRRGVGDAVVVGGALGEAGEGAGDVVGGVGIGAPNVHWWIRGTKDRYRGQKRRASAGVARPGKSLQPTGRMPGFAEGLAMRAAIKAAPSAQRSMAMRAKKQFDKEIARQLIRS